MLALDTHNRAVTLVVERCGSRVCCGVLQAVNLAPIPQSLEFRGSEADILSRWGLNTLNTTAGDWLRLAPSQPTLKLQQPLLVAADVLVSGVVPAAGGSNNRGSTTGRRLQQQQQSSQLQLVCDADKQPGSAVQIRWVLLGKGADDSCRSRGAMVVNLGPSMHLSTQLLLLPAVVPAAGLVVLSCLRWTSAAVPAQLWTCAWTPRAPTPHLRA